jgi:hypothetical protein
MQKLIGTGDIDTDDWPSETLGIYVNGWHVKQKSAKSYKVHKV